MLKKTIALFLIPVLIFSVMAFPLSMNAAVLSSDSETGEISGSFTYGGLIENVPFDYHYNDAYFNKSGFIYNPSLATMSLCLSLSAFPSKDEIALHPAENAAELYTDLGFEDFEAVNYDVMTEANSVAFTIGHKRIAGSNGEKTLIAIASRGGGYFGEWAGNFQLGTKGNHEGFTLAADMLLEYLRQYIDARGEKISGEISLWLSGYSRGGGVINILAGHLNRNPELGENVKLSKENLYAYTFEAPKGALTSDIANRSLYANIFNIVNKNDAIASFFPCTEKINFSRYGTDLMIPLKESTSQYSMQYNIMMDFYNKLGGGLPKLLDSFKARRIVSGEGSLLNLPSMPEDTNKQLTQSIFNDEIVDFFVQNIFISRENYVLSFQKILQTVILLALGNEGKFGFFVDALKVNFESSMPLVLVYALSNADDSNKKLYNLLYDIVFSSMKTAGIEADISKQDLASLITVLTAAINDLTDLNPDLSATFLMNLPGMAMGHLPELTLAWLQSCDVNYASENQPQLNSLNFGSYRKLIINGYVSADIYCEGVHILSMSRNKINYINNAFIPSSIIPDIEKTIYLPADADYRIKITSESNTDFSLSFGEYNAQTNRIEKTVGFYSKSIKHGGEFNAYAPKYSQEYLDTVFYGATDTKYTLKKNGINIEPNTPVTVVDDLNKVSLGIINTNPELGSVKGAGIYTKGADVSVFAYANDDAVFAGWYKNGICVSNDKIYRFTIEKDMELSAVFSSENVSKAVIETTAEPTGKIQRMPGDVNNDGQITAIDARLALRISAELEKPSESIIFENADYDGDGYITATDARKILRLSAGLGE